MTDTILLTTIDSSLNNDIFLIKGSVFVENNNTNQPFTSSISPVQPADPSIPQTVTTSVNPAFSSPQSVAGTVPQAVSGSPEFAFASVTARSIANFIDGIIVSIIVIPFNLPGIIDQFKIFFTGYNAGNFPANSEFASSTSANPLFTILSLVGSLLGMIYPIYFIGKTGATPGKKIMGVSVIDKESKQAPGMLKAFLREIVGKIISSFLMLGYLWALWDKEKQTWHDKITGTVVVRTK